MTQSNQKLPGVLTRIALHFDGSPNGYAVEADGRTWRWASDFRPHFTAGERTVYFDEARSVETKPYHTGVAEGVVTRYADFDGVQAAFETIVAVQPDTGRLEMTFVPLEMPLHARVRWPGMFTADEPGSYAVINQMQGYLLPSDWPEAAPRLPFGGQMASSSAYMPWLGQVAADGACLCAVAEPWDCAYEVDHPAGGPTRIAFTNLPQLGRQAYAHRYTALFFPAGSDYVTLCKAYRAMAREAGKVVTLREKAQRLAGIDRLIGASVMHVGTKSHVTPDSAYYDKENPANNDKLVPFSVHADRVRALRHLGIPQLYLHLDGWGEPGYDNKHPDYLPPCAAAGGWEGLRALQDAVHAEGYLFGLHDQYRDYYLDAPTYDPDNAVLLADGTLYEMSRWAGGRQNYLCPALQPDYVRRNYTRLFEHGIHPDAVYLDVFTCNEPDECANPRHTVTRRECLAYRAECFDYMTAHDVICSSEEANDWAVPSLVFCHWAPYADGGIPVPLFNLVYHDCFLVPWKLGYGEWGTPKGQPGFLHALLNGGMGYVESDWTGRELSQNVAQCRAVSALQKQVAYAEMVSHAFVGGDKNVQRTEFADGTSVTVDFAQGTYAVRVGGGGEERGTAGEA